MPRPPKFSPGKKRRSDAKRSGRPQCPYYLEELFDKDGERFTWTPKAGGSADADAGAAETAVESAPTAEPHCLRCKRPVGNHERTPEDEYDD
jgi:hypothetical protein